MESRANRSSIKPGTALAGPARPANRSSNRTGGSRGPRKNSRVACEGGAYTGAIGQPAQKVLSSSRVSDVGSMAGSKVPMTRTSDVLNPVAAKKDGFFVHKRGGPAQSYGASQRNRSYSNEKRTEIASSNLGKLASNNQVPLTMEQLAKEGAAQAMGGEDSDGDNQSDLTFKNDTTAMSDLNSLQNFSYYGRRFQDRNQRNQESPVASDAVSMTQPKFFPGGAPQGESSGAPTPSAQVVEQKSKNLQRKESGLRANISADTMSENVSSLKGFTKTPAAAGAGGAEYKLEEKMNDNLMKQFEPLFSADKQLPGQADKSRGDNLLLNSISDFSALNEGNSLSKGASSGQKSRAQLFQQAKETLMAQRVGGNNRPVMARTSANFNPQADSGKKGRQAAGGSASRAMNDGAMNKTTQNFTMKKSTAKQVLPPKLPPRSTMSPAMNSFKAKQLQGQSTTVKKGVPANLMASQSNVSQAAASAQDSGFRDNLYFAHQEKLRGTETPQTEIVYKRGARSISKRRTEGSNLALAGAAQDKALNSSIVAVSRKNLHRGTLGESESKQSLNTEQRREKYVGTCKACQDRAVDGHEHSVSHSLDRRLQKFNQNFKPSGHCKKHNTMGCEKCSFGSSKGSRVSSLDSNNFVSGDILKKHRIAPRSEIVGKVKVQKSVTRQGKRPRQMSNTRNSLVQKSLNSNDIPRLNLDGNRVRSMPRAAEENSQINESAVLKRASSMRRSTKNAEVRQLTDKLINYGKRGNRPSANMLPKPQNFTTSEVNVKVQGRQEPPRVRSDSSESRGYSEYVNLRAARQASGNVGQIPGFTRILSANTNMQRYDLSKKLQQKDHANLLDKDIKKLAEEWEGDPHDPEFWARFEGENSQTQLRKKELLKGQGAQHKQLDVLDKQSNVFKQLRETDDTASERTSMRGTVMNFGGARGSHPGVELTRRSNASFLNTTLQPGEQQTIENIPTEIDQNELQSMFQQNPNLLASKPPITTHKKLFQDPSSAVLTDYDITDEVGNQFGMSIRHQIEFRDKGAVDQVAEDRNIDEKAVAPAETYKDYGNLLSSKPPRQVEMAGNLFSGQTVKSGVASSSPMQLGDIASAQKEETGGRASYVTGGFPSEKQSTVEKAQVAQSKESKVASTTPFEDQGIGNFI